MKTKSKILVIVGPTASGKTGLAIELAKKFNGEVISADSRQVYKGLDIGSAKVTKREMDGIPHHLLDIADPKDIYTAADFKRDAAAEAEAILSRGKLPIIAGGTFFYIDTILGKIDLPAVPPDQALRAELEEKSTADLLSILETLDPVRAETVEKENKRRLIRSIEVAKSLGVVPPITPSDPPYDILSIGLSVDMETHGEMIKKRLLERLEAGMVAEVEGLISAGVTHERLENLGLEYRYVSRYLRSLITYEQMVEELVVKSRQYARRQLTWLKRGPLIHWFKRDDKKVFAVVDNFLSK